MKKFLMLLMSIALVFGASACGGVPDNSSSSDEYSSEETSSEEVSSEEESEEESIDEESSEEESSEEVSNEDSSSEESMEESSDEESSLDSVEESTDEESEEESSLEDDSQEATSSEISSEEESSTEEVSSEESSEEESSTEEVSSEESSEEERSSEEISSEISSEESSSEEISSEESSEEESSSEDSSVDDTVYNYIYKIVNGGTYYSNAQSLNLRFENADNTVDLGYTGWTSPDENTEKFKKYIKINGNPLPDTAYVCGFDQKAGLSVQNINMNVGDVLTIDRGAVFTHGDIKMTLAVGLSYTWNGTTYDVAESEHYVVAVSYYTEVTNASAIAIRFSNNVDVMTQNTLDLGYDLSGDWYRTDTALLEQILIKGVPASQIDGIFLATMGQKDGVYIGSDTAGGLNMQVGDTIVIPEGLKYTTSGGKTITTTSAFTYTYNGTGYDVERGLMWNTEELFNTVPEIREMPELNFGANITAFKFKSAPTETKTETWVFGAVGVPTTAMPAGGYPAVVLVHGGAGRVRTDWIQYWNGKGYVAIAIDMWGNQLDANGNRIPNPDSGFVEKEPYYYGIEHPEYSWVYHSVNNVILAHNIVRARADVNAEKTAITGISWGGYITSIVSGVDSRFKAIAPVYGCGYIDEDSFWTERYAQAFGNHGVWNGPDKQVWISLYDPSSYIPRATAPMLFISGVGDTCFSVTGRVRTAQLYKGEKAYYSQRYGFDHGDYFTVTYEIYAFFQETMFGQDTLTEIGDITVSGSVATFNYTGQAKFNVVNFVYTTSTDADSHKWTWQVTTVTAKNGVYSYQLPAGVKAYYFETISTTTGDGTGELHQSTKITLV